MNDEPKTVSPQDRIDTMGDVSVEFMATVLGLGIKDGYLITDQSALSDFKGCQPCKEPETIEYEQWYDWVVPFICKRYGIEPFSPHIYLVDLFSRIRLTRETRKDH
jgi:hypothetical protein